MFSLRTHLIICLSLFGALIGLALLGNLLAAVGVIRPLHGAARTVGMGVLLALFVAAGLSAIPVMVKLVLGAQARLGGRDAPVIGAMVARQTAVVWVLWLLILAGLAVAVPAMVADGFFGPSPKLWARQAIGRMAAGPSLGRLEARPGMALADVARRSSLPIDLRHPGAAISGGGVFDFAIAGAAIEFPRARYYFITTYENDPSRVQALDVGVSPGKVTRRDLDAANGALRARLVADGWLAGHEVYRGDEDIALHGGATHGPEGRSWLKAGMVLDIEARRLDDEKPGEDPATAGQWIQFIELWPSRDQPGIDRLVFAPATSPTTAAP